MTSFFFWHPSLRRLSVIGAFQKDAMADRPRVSDYPNRTDQKDIYAYNLAVVSLGLVECIITIWARDLGQDVYQPLHFANPRT